YMAYSECQRYGTIWVSQVYHGGHAALAPGMPVVYSRLLFWILCARAGRGIHHLNRRDGCKCCRPPVCRIAGEPGGGEHPPQLCPGLQPRWLCLHTAGRELAYLLRTG